MHFTREALGEVFGRDFNRDIASHAGIASAIHLAHAAFADWLDDLVRPEAVALAQCHQ